MRPEPSSTGEAEVGDLGAVAEVAEAGLDTKSAKQLVNRVIKTLLDSDHVEEIYGTDDELRRAFRQLLGE